MAAENAIRPCPGGGRGGPASMRPRRMAAENVVGVSSVALVNNPLQ